jgi:CRISPR-associated protein (TIGR02584 family)
MKPKADMPREKPAGHDAATWPHATEASDGAISSPPTGQMLATPVPLEPASYSHRVLLAVTGLSPQIVTETLYALTQAQRPSFVPTEVRLVTTVEGAERVRLTLLSSDPGWFGRLCRDYGIGGVRFDEAGIHVLTDASGAPLCDIRSQADNELVADALTDIVRGLTAREDVALHVSIAGGRKTMGYYAGYALSLYGRPQDRLSHVLVSAPFESNPEFFYPTPYSRVIYTYPPESRPIDSRDAEVSLAEIPFVRLREGLPPELREGRACFSEVVAEAQKALPPVAVEIDPGHSLVRAGGERIRFAPAELAFYWLLAERRLAGRPGVHWSDKGLEIELGALYARLVNPNSGHYERFEKTSMTREILHARKRHVNAALEKALGKRRAAPYLIQTQAPLPSKGRCQPYALKLSPQAIAIRPASLPTTPAWDAPATLPIAPLPDHETDQS